MRRIFFFIFFIVALSALSKEESDSTKIPVKVSGDLSINLNGIASVPAFTLGKPALIANISVKKGRFSYDPMIAYSFELKPWLIDNWFHYKLIDKPNFELRTGINISMFFSEYETPDETIYRGQRYGAFELAGKYNLNNTNSMSLMFWYDKGADPGTITGYFIDLAWDIWDIRLSKTLLMAINMQLFYIDYTGNSDGFFIAPKISFSTPKLPLNIFGQGIIPISSNIDPYPDFQWNIGLGYSF